MGIFGSSSEKDTNKVVIPPEILARISVLGDHVTHTSEPVTDLGGAVQLRVPSQATVIPHGPETTFPQGSTQVPGSNHEAPQTTFVVAPEVAESSPFLQDLSPQELAIPKKEQAGIEPPLFLSDKTKPTAFGLGQEGLGSFARNVSPAVAAKSISFTDDPSAEPSHTRSRVAIRVFVALFLVLIAGLGGMYYFFYVYSDESLLSNQPMETGDVQTTDISSQATMPETQGGFSLRSANYLPLNIETVSQNEIRTEIQKLAEQAKSAEIKGSIEFLVTDQTNTPIAFSRFVTLAGLKFPEAIVSATDEHFSFFLFMDQGRTRVGFRVNLKSSENTESVFKKIEGDFPLALQGWFFEANIAPVKKAVFRQGMYQNVPIRYTNVPGVENLSVDYAIIDNIWYIGTSKDTVRGILDYSKK